MISMTRTAKRVVGALLASLGLCLAAHAQSPFYQPSPADLVGQPGTLIRSEPAVGAPEGALAHRILFRSTGLDGEPIAVSGLIVIPQGPLPQGGRPIVAWAHPTSGVVPKCAPSLARLKFAAIPGLEAMLRLGYVVVATDYPGLGVAEPVHPYLVGSSEAYSVLDSVRLARAMPGAGNGDRFVAWGHSQGGQAALFTGLEAKRYAPELQLLGVAAAAPATDLATLLRDDFNTVGGKNLTAMTLWSWDKVFGASIGDVVELAALPAVDGLADECIESLFDILERGRTGKPLDTVFLSVPDITTIAPYKNLLATNTPQPLPRDIPVFLAQGSTDETVRPAVTNAYWKSLCKAGTAARMLVVHDGGHAFIARDAAEEAVEWMADRFAGLPAPSDCP